MSGWALLALLGVAAGALLALLRVARPLWSLVAAFLMLGAAGYAWQGHPALRAQPAVADAVKFPVDPVYQKMRDAMFGRFGGESVYFGISDRQLGDGDTELATSVMIGAVQYAPTNVAFWTELGNTIALHDHGALSPAALYAFQRAMLLAPEHPGPPFFLGWAYIRAGDLVRARMLWARSLALTPETAEYRQQLADMLAQLDAIGPAAPR